MADNRAANRDDRHPGFKEREATEAAAPRDSEREAGPERQDEVAEAGRRGGEASSATIYRPSGVRPDGATRARQEQEEAAEADGQASAPSGAWAIAKQVFQEFGRDHGTLMAAAVTFYLMLSIVPLIVVGVSIFGYVMSDEQARSTVLQFATQYLPEQRELLVNSLDAVQEARGTIGLIGLATLLLTASGGFATLETAINAIWKVENRSFLMNKLYAFLMLLLIGSLAVASVAITTVLSWAESIPGLGWLSSSWVGMVLGPLLSLTISGVMFSLIYKLLPNVHVEWKPALIAGFITAVLWEAFKYAYTWYTSSSFQGDQAATYGVLAGFVGLLFWIYYSSALVLLGSELTWVLAGRPGEERRTPAGC
jgi:membrane protein